MTRDVDEHLDDPCSASCDPVADAAQPEYDNDRVVAGLVGC